MPKILIVPSRFITNIHNREFTRWKNFLFSAKDLKFKNAFDSFNSHMLCSEIYNYADIPNINGKDQTFILGNYYKEYTEKQIPKNTRYPSIHNNPHGTHLTLRGALSMIKKFDCVLIGIQSNEIGNKIRKKALNHNIPVVLIDHFDHPQVYKDPSYENIFRGLKPEKDFNMYFKHDLPKNKLIDHLVYPLAPMPCNPNNYPQINHTWNKKNISVFYRGRKSHNPRKDRILLSEEIKKQIEFSHIEHIGQSEKITIFEYVNNLSKTKIAFTPSGKVWDSTRHTEIGLYNCVPLIPEPDCEVVSDCIKDTENSIVYNINDINEGEINKSISDIIDKVRSLIKNDKKLIEIADNWRNEVLLNHTVNARSNMVLKKINQLI